MLIVKVSLGERGRVKFETKRKKGFYVIDDVFDS